MAIMKKQSDIVFYRTIAIVEGRLDIGQLMLSMYIERDSAGTCSYQKFVLDEIYQVWMYCVNQVTPPTITQTVYCMDMACSLKSLRCDHLGHFNEHCDQCRFR